MIHQLMQMGHLIFNLRHIGKKKILGLISRANGVPELVFGEKSISSQNAESQQTLKIIVLTFQNTEAACD